MEQKTITVFKNNVSFKVIDTFLNRDFWLQHHSSWEQQSHDWLDKHLNPNKVFLDIGSWIGPLTLYAAQKCKVVAIEPDPIAYDELLKNLMLNNLSNVLPINKAVSFNNESISIGCQVLGQSGTSTTFTTNAVNVQCLTINQILQEADNKNVSCIKIDIEAHEQVLLKDPMMLEITVPLRIAFHPGLFQGEEKKEYISDITQFFKAKKITVPLILPEFFEVNFN